jgi:hypothetical protein
MTKQAASPKTFVPEARYASREAYGSPEAPYRGVPINREEDARLLSTQTPFAIPRSPLKTWTGGMAALVLRCHERAERWLNGAVVGFIYQNNAGRVTVCEAELEDTSRGEVLVWSRTSAPDGSPLLLAIMERRGQLTAQDMLAPGGARCALYDLTSLEGNMITTWAELRLHQRVLMLEMKRREREIKRLFHNAFPADIKECEVQATLMRELAMIVQDGDAIKRAASCLGVDLSNPAKYLASVGANEED